MECSIIAIRSENGRISRHESSFGRLAPDWYHPKSLKSQSREIFFVPFSFVRCLVKITANGLRLGEGRDF